MTTDMVLKLTPSGYWVVSKCFKSGHRAGFVGIPEDHSLFGRRVDHPAVRQITTLLGPVTYAAGAINGWDSELSPMWWFGVDNMAEKMPRDTMNDVLKACMGLARQLEQYDWRKSGVKADVALEYVQNADSHGHLMTLLRAAGDGADVAEMAEEALRRATVGGRDDGAVELPETGG